MGDDRADIVQCDAALFGMAFAHGQEAAMHRQMQAIGGNVDYAIHTSSIA